jgi:hypothetical protein
MSNLKLYVEVETIELRRNFDRILTILEIKI